MNLKLHFANISLTSVEIRIGTAWYELGVLDNQRLVYKVRQTDPVPSSCPVVFLERRDLYVVRTCLSLLPLPPHMVVAYGLYIIARSRWLNVSNVILSTLGDHWPALFFSFPIHTPKPSHSWQHGLWVAGWIQNYMWDGKLKWHRQSLPLTPRVNAGTWLKIVFPHKLAKSRSSISLKL